MLKIKRLPACILTAILLLTAGGCTAQPHKSGSDLQEFTAWFFSSPWKEENTSTELSLGEKFSIWWDARPGGKEHGPHAGDTDLTAEEKGEPVYATSIRDANPAYIPEYENYNADDFYDMCDQVRTLAGENHPIKAFRLFDDLWTEYDKIVSLDTVASILYMEDASNEDLQAEADYMDALAIEAYDQICILGHELATGSTAKKFRTFTDEESFQLYEEYEPMSDEELELTQRETELINQYYDVTDNALSIPFEYNGKSYTLEEIYDETVMDAMDYDTWYAVYEGCLKKLCEEAGPIFVELVQIRDRLAKFYDYDNYCDYADESLYARDYTAEDLKGLKSAAKKLQMAYMDYYDVYDLLPQTDGDLTQLMSQLQEIADQCSPYASDACSFLRENTLYSIGCEDSRFDQGYTTYVYQPQFTPYIYYKSCSSAYDLTSMIHELGHFTDTYLDEGYTFVTESLDIAEIQSTGLQMLASTKFSSCYDMGDSALLNASQLYEMLDSVVSGCLYDDWQRAIYQDPDMPLEDMCELFRQTQMDYGMEDYPGAQYEWILVPHNFNLPMYYISYATSAVESLQIWQIAQTDFDRAAGIWKDIIDYSDEEQGGDGMPQTFQMTMLDAGLKPFTDTDTVEDLLKDIMKALEKDARTGRLLN